MNNPIRYILLFLSLFVCTAYGQTTGTATGTVTEKQEEIPSSYTYSADSLAFYISLHHKGEAARLKALYSWMTSNMKYNVYTTFESRNDVYSEEKDVRNTLKTRSGVCRNFALVFKTVADAMDIPAYVVEGYVKTEGTLMTDPHAWCCAKVNGQWSLYDVTFGMGSIANNQFTSNPNMNYCQVAPTRMLQNHMPFDPIWQLIDRPYQFHIYDKSSSLPSASTERAINYNDTIRAYTRLTKVQQQADVNRRIKANGTPNPLVDYFLKLTESNIQVYKGQEIYDIYKKAIKSFNKAADYYNDFIHYRQAKFQPEKEEKEVNELLDASNQANTSAYNYLQSLANAPEEYETAIRNLMEDVKFTIVRIEKQKAFVKDYYKASASRRKSFFKE